MPDVFFRPKKAPGTRKGEKAYNNLLYFYYSDTGEAVNIFRLYFFKQAVMMVFPLIMPFRKTGLLIAAEYASAPDPRDKRKAQK